MGCARLSVTSSSGFSTPRRYEVLCVRG
jgi:hypothetical protein